MTREVAIEAQRVGRLGAELTQRIVSAAVLVPAALILVWLGSPYFTAGLVLLGAVVVAEWFRMISVPLTSSAYAVALGALVAAGIGADLNGAGFAVMVLAVGVMLTALTVTEAKAAERTRRGLRYWAAGGLAYAGLGMIAFIALRQGDHGLAVIVLIFAVSWATDVFAYFVGRRIGGAKLWPAISPNKTWSGAIGGLIAGGVAGAALMAGLGVAVSLAGVAFYLALSAIGQLGDLFESGAKRRFGIKDSGRLIPGHGGLMDRVDGVLAAGVLALVVGAVAGGALQPSLGVLLAIGGGT